MEPITSLDDFFPDDPNRIDFSSKPYTRAEYDHFITHSRMGYMSERFLSLTIYNPARGYFDDRAWFKQPKKKLSEWQKLVAVVMEFVPKHKTPKLAGLIANQLRGKAKKGTRKEYNIDPPMDAVEAYAFCYWLREGEELDDDHYPRAAETLFVRAEAFRSLPNHFEHVNYARYGLNELLVQNEQKNADPISAVPDEPPASLEEHHRVFSEINAAFGMTIFELPDLNADKDAS